MSRNLKAINLKTLDLIQSSQKRFDLDDIQSSQLSCGATVLDFGSDRVGTVAAGILLAKICMGDLAAVTVADNATPLAQSVHVETGDPLFACMASQYAGWPFALENYFAICSGPARIARGQENVLLQYDLVEPSHEAVAVLETATVPGDDVAFHIAQQCGVPPQNVTICIAKTSSVPGSLQVVARSLESAMHKLHELDFDLRTIRSGRGSAPFPPIGSSDLQSMGWTNDAILYGATVDLEVETDDETIEQIGNQIPSSIAAEYGQPFLEIFEKSGRDFYQIDPLLFGPANVNIHNLNSGNLFSYGQTDLQLLTRSWNPSL